MKALAIDPRKVSFHAIARPQPGLREPDQVKVQILKVAICCTDRAEAAGGRARAPAGQKE